jgi:hypothetical protein
MSLQGERHGEEEAMPSRLFVKIFSTHPGQKKMLLLMGT